MGAFVDQGEQAAADNLLIDDRAPLKADLRRIILDQPGDFRIRLRSAALRIDGDAISTLLPEPAQFAAAVDHSGLGAVGLLHSTPLADPPANRSADARRG